MEENYTNIKKILVKLTEMYQTNRQDVIRHKEMVEELSENIMQLNFLVLELSRNTNMTIRALTKRIIDLEMTVGIETSESIEGVDDE